MIYIGIDPGSSGGMAFMCEDDLYCTKMPETERDVWLWLRSSMFYETASSTVSGVFAFIEKVGAMPNQGVTSMFSFGRSYGFLRGILVALEIPFEEVTPQKWQKEFGLIQRGQKLTQVEKKNRNKQKAQQLWPHLRVTHSTADALLIAEYGRRVNANRA